ncbi:uncharacterized protein LOC131666470 isoform X2 [Phymastichus coffea]|uniref:uncharacterized protein LOC131666470 isoform X2 n=1 Tax=Phymastichus coffea TaxID=108790 RepID=UPI00273B390E|nr:uncharacterized protein LOC131666470 isoform X2 [Phymastichus coffea]
MNFTIENNILKGAKKPISEDRKLGQVIWNVLNKSPDHVAQIDAETGEQTTFSQMKDRSICCAVWMKELAIRPGDVVVAVTHNHLDCYLPVFATFFVDAVFNAWNQNITLFSARRFIKMFTPKLIFASEKVIDVLIEAATLENLKVHFVVFGKHSNVQSLNEILNEQTKEEIDKFTVVDERSAQDVAAIMLSSGTTGFPKGVMLSHRSILMANVSNQGRKISTYLWYSTLDWVSCISFMFQTLLKYSTRIISLRIDLESLFQTIEKYKVNFAFVPPILVNYIAKCDIVENYDLQSLKIFVVGGCKLTRQVLDAVQQKFPTVFIHNGYGSTETGGGVSYKTAEMSKNVDSIGFVTTNCQIKFVDLTSGQALGSNQQGEVCIKTPNITLGYYKDPEATKQAFDEDGWYHTGDIGYYNEAGEIFIVDRIKEIIKYRNSQISPAEIEEVLLSHPEVREAAVVGIPRELDGDWPVAFVKKLPSSRCHHIGENAAQCFNVLQSDEFIYV